MKWRLYIDNYMDLIDWLLRVATSRKPDRSEVMVALQYCRDNKGVPFFNKAHRTLANIYKDIDKLAWHGKTRRAFLECLRDLYEASGELEIPVVHLLKIAGLTDVVTIRSGPGLWGASGLRWVREDETDLLPGTLEYLVVRSTPSARRCGIHIDVCRHELNP